MVTVSIAVIDRKVLGNACGNNSSHSFLREAPTRKLCSVGQGLIYTEWSAGKTSGEVYPGGSPVPALYSV